MPDSLESGTLNLPGIAGLHAGMRFALSHREAVQEHIRALCGYMREELLNIPGVRVYTRPDALLLTFNVEGISSQEAATLLDARHIAVRGGLHCAPGVHRFLHTLEGGCIRVSPGRENTHGQCAAFVRAASDMTK
jgi:selenocysteine lyase/cysteine desulfurase